MSHIDDDKICMCGLCYTTHTIFSFAINNFIKFVIASSLLQLLYGYYYCDSIIYVVGYINLICTLNQLKYAVLLKIMTFVLVPIYYYTQLCNFNKPPPLISLLTHVCILFQLVGYAIKAFVYYVNLR